jgi:hypothetical protein
VVSLPPNVVIALSDGDQGGDESVFDGRRAGLLGCEPFEKLRHSGGTLSCPQCLDCSSRELILPFRKPEGLLRNREMCDDAVNETETACAGKMTISPFRRHFSYLETTQEGTGNADSRLRPNPTETIFRYPCESK